MSKAQTLKPALGLPDALRIDVRDVAASSLVPFMAVEKQTGEGRIALYWHRGLLDLEIEEERRQVVASQRRLARLQTALIAAIQHEANLEERGL